MTKTAFVEAKAIRNALDFSTVLSHYDIPIAKGTPPQVFVVCPFHDDHKPTCSVNLDRKIFNCFACHTTGNALEFIMMMEIGEKDKRHLPQASQKAMEIMGIRVEDLKPAPKSSAKRRNKPSEKRKVPQAPKPAPDSKKPSQAKISASKEVSVEELTNPPLDMVLSDLETDHPFFEQRGLSQQAIETFGLGKCNKGIMRGRIVIPVHNQNGELIAYVGRHVEDDPGDDSPRYRFPKGFHKNIELFNLHRAKELGRRSLVVVEGYWSVIRLHLSGIPAVATFGASLSEQQAELIANSGYKLVTVIYDGDEAGRAGADQAVTMLSKHLYARQIVLDEGVKPDTMPERILTRLA